MTSFPLSFVMALRDPHYGPKNGMDSLHRMHLAVNVLVHWANVYSLPCELVVVEWNARAPFEFFHRMRWPPTMGRVVIRWMDVPPCVHTRFPNSDVMPLHEPMARNVGIRRARGTFVLATNPDIIYPRRLMQALARGRFSEHAFYRVDRVDVGSHVSLTAHPEEIEKLCRQGCFMRHALYGSFPIVPSRFPASLLEFSTRRRELRRYWRGEGAVACPDGLHRNASGDFFLMHRDDWLRVRGYPELATHSHVDSILCWVADSWHLRQVILRRHAIYHLDHSRGSHGSLPQTDWPSWYRTWVEHKRTGAPMIVNGPEWGLADEHVVERVLP